MHIETLRTFCDVVALGSLSLAARQNHVTQSAVSQQLRSLEQRYGRKLVERAPRTAARPTEAGQLLYSELEPLLASLADLERRVRARPVAIEGKVRVATVYSVGLHSLPPALKLFLEKHPEVSVRLEYRRTDQIYAACSSGELDFGIVAGNPEEDERELAFRHLFAPPLLESQQLEEADRGFRVRHPDHRVEEVHAS